MKCLIDECGSPVKSLGLCEKHYFRQRRTGTTELVKPDPVERFWRKVKKTKSCWMFKGAYGHGQFKVDGRSVMAHRYAYELVVGPIPDGMVLDHLCRKAGCVNPAHLEPVTQAENVRRGVSAAAQNARKTHCKRGHEFTSENTRVTANGNRVCRACQREGMRFLREELPRVGMKNNNGNALKTHCKYGHPLEGDNLMVLPKQRRCRTCHNRQSAEGIARARERRNAQPAVPAGN
jgi:hypothetical protein